MNKDIKKIADHYGIRHQKGKFVEELNELIEALHTGDLECIIDELADTLIMIEQYIYLADIDTTKVLLRIKYKIERQLKRIAKKKSK